MVGVEVDAVYIALPNHQHLDYTLRAARAGVHVLVREADEDLKHRVTVDGHRVSACFHSATSSRRNCSIFPTAF